MMIDWINAPSIIEGIGVSRKEAERIAQAVKQLNHDLIEFNKTALSTEEVEKDMLKVLIEWPPGL